MKKLEKSVPIIRFKGFYEAWEQRKLRDIANYRNGKAHEQVEDEDGKYTIINSKFISTNGKVQRYTNEQVEPIFDGEIAMVLSDLPNGKALAKLFLVKEDGKYTLNQRIAGITPNENIDPIFLNFRMNRNNYFLKFDSGVTQTNLSKSQVENFIALYPTFDEQYKIGLFFTQLDDTIALHQRKLDTLKRMKKGLLQQMFPNNEEKVPRLRFADFNEKWERCKISSFARNTYGGGTPKTNVPEYWQGRIPWIQSGDLLIDSLFNIIPKKHVTGSAVKSSATKCIPANSIAIVTRVGVGKLAFIPFEYTTSQDFLSLSNLRVDSNFGTYSIYIMLQRELNNIQGSTIKGITKSDLLEKNINKPLNRIEQERIGVSLKLLDNIITLHQSKLEKLSSLKKVYLQRMFI
ncbi:restriction endonuclease subunit S [Listeria monocytogenes]|uniref:restriction endonuclease subunit S n=1 Tax=Listeria monocytogenes TaxID=1639 RepID=UPI00074D6D49|nr:restriction endonuclease subunit S [Listeria monocytogenes]EAD1175322.1 restriction endonuclease subunit S [Listeria monocytogenes]EAK9243441.1 restriction endonuclease subunit S [Listeria monocytogenes]PDD74363.1 restriction endonuclease subunit S [Listeria monocytogenes]CUL36088.1 Specificity subunit (modular protein) [Listeria monocytogenes]HAB7965442.1 restriction endonuclease subunit S [Listeria monocytogenes]